MLKLIEQIESGVPFIVYEDDCIKRRGNTGERMVFRGYGGLTRVPYETTFSSFVNAMPGDLLGAVWFGVSTINVVDGQVFRATSMSYLDQGSSLFLPFAAGLRLSFPSDKPETNSDKQDPMVVTAMIGRTSIRLEVGSVNLDDLVSAFENDQPVGHHRISLVA